MAKKKDKETSKEIEHILKSGLVMMREGEYFGIIDTEDGKKEIKLGSNEGELLDNLSEIEKSGTVLHKWFETSTVDSEEQSETADNIDVALQTQTTTDIMKEVLDGIEDLSVEDGQSDFTILLNGVDVQLATDHRLPADHPVKTLPLAFYWNDIKYNVENGSTITNNGWTVLRKDHGRRIGISTKRDDSPRQNFWSCKGYVLCVTKKEQFVMKKLKQAIKFKLAAAQSMEQRKALAKDANLKSKVDIAASQQIYADDFRAVLQQAAQTGSVASEGKISANDLMKKLETNNMEDLLSLSSQVDSAIQNGQLMNTASPRKALSESDI